MLVVMKAEASEAEISALCGELEKLGVRSHPVRGAVRTTVCPAGTVSEAAVAGIGAMAGVAGILHPTHSYRLASREVQPEPTLVRFPNQHTSIGGTELSLLGRATASSALRVAEAEALKALGFRGFVLPRELGRGEGMKLDRAGWDAVRSATGMELILEVCDQQSLDEASDWAGMILIGARSMQNFSLLRSAGRQNKPVVIERGQSATLEEFLMAAEYVLSEGNPWVVLLEAGARSFATHTRNTLDLSLLPLLEELTHLPVVVAPGVATARPVCTPALSRASVAAGADGLVLEVGQAATTTETQELHALIGDLRKVAPIVGRTLNEEKHAL